MPRAGCCFWQKKSYTKPKCLNFCFLPLLWMLLWHMHVTSGWHRAAHVNSLWESRGSHTLHICYHRKHKFLAPLCNIRWDGVQLATNTWGSHCWWSDILLWCNALRSPWRRQWVCKRARSAVRCWCWWRVLIYQSWLFTRWHGNVIDSHLWHPLLRPVTIHQLARVGCSWTQCRRACFSSSDPLFLRAIWNRSEQKASGLCWVWCVPRSCVCRAWCNRTVLRCPWGVELWWWLERWWCLRHCWLYRCCRWYHRWSNRSYLGWIAAGWSAGVARLLLVELSYLSWGTLKGWLYWLWLDV